MNFSNFLHAALNRWKNDFFLMALFDWTSRCCTFTRVGGVKNRLFEKNCQKTPLFIRKNFFFQKRSNIRQRWARLGNQSDPGWQKSNFWKIYDFLTIFGDFWLFLQNGWLLTFVAHDKKCLASKNSGGLIRVTFHESNSKKKFLKNFCKKSWIFVHF